MSMPPHGPTPPVHDHTPHGYGPTTPVRRQPPLQQPPGPWPQPHAPAPTTPRRRGDGAGLAWGVGIGALALAIAGVAGWAVLRFVDRGPAASAVSTTTSASPTAPPTTSAAVTPPAPADGPAQGEPPGRAPGGELTHLPLELAAAARPTVGPAVEVTFVNHTAGEVDVYWIDTGGRRVHYRTLAAGESYVQPTYATHPWIVTGQGRDLALVVAGILPGRVTVTDAD